MIGGTRFSRGAGVVYLAWVHFSRVAKAVDLFFRWSECDDQSLTKHKEPRIEVGRDVERIEVPAGAREVDAKIMFDVLNRTIDTR